VREWIMQRSLRRKRRWPTEEDSSRSGCRTSYLIFSGPWWSGHSGVGVPRYSRTPAWGRALWLWCGQKTWCARLIAGAFWHDVRIDRVLPYKEAKDEESERHVHPLQLDVIDRALVLWSNPGENVLSPFAGVGSEIYGAVTNGRRGIGIELKTAFYNQALKNLEAAVSVGWRATDRQEQMFDDESMDEPEAQEAAS
jgi:hypothetical protein